MSLLARLSLANRGLIAITAVIVLLFGAFLIPSLKQQLLPSLVLPTVSIIVPLDGAGPEIVEQQITVPIEDAIAGVDGIETITSTSAEGVASIQAEFEFGTDIDEAIGNLETAVNEARADLPPNTEPDIQGGGTDDLPALSLAASKGSGNDLRDLATRLEGTVIPELEATEGVQSAALTGTREEQVAIKPDRDRLAETGVTPDAIATALNDNGVSVPAGAITEGQRSLPVQVGSRITSLERLRDIVLPSNDGTVRIRDVATVERRLEPVRSLNRTNGKPSLGISVKVTQDASAVAVSKRIRQKLDDLQRRAGATLTITFDQAPFVERSIKSLVTEGVIGLVMAIIIILLFLRSARSTIVTAVSIPLSLVVALIALKMSDYSLNLLTVGGLTIAVGRVVDDSIVVLENIKRHMSYGGDKREAVLTAVREVAAPVTASTITTVAVFLPIAFVSGFIGQLFAPFAITVSVALLASLVVSLTVIPVLAYQFLEPPRGGPQPAEEVRRAAEEKELGSWMQRLYLPIVRFATRRRLITLFAGVLVLFATFSLAGGLKTNFLEQSGQDTLTLNQELPVGSSLATVDSAVRQTERIMAGRGDIRAYDVQAGGDLGVNKAKYSVSLTEEADAEAVKQDLENAFDRRPSVGKLTVTVGQESGSTDSKLQVVVKAAEAGPLADAAEQVRKAMAGTPNVTDVASTLAANVPRLQVRVSDEPATAAGLSEKEIGQAVASAFQGGPMGEVPFEDAPLPVVLDMGEPPDTVTELRALRLPAGNGTVALSEVADVIEVKGPVQVEHVDGERSAKITGSTTAGSDVGATTDELTKRLEALKLPSGATYEIGGVSADQDTAFTDLAYAVLAAIALVFLVMVATFRSFVQPMILLVSIPFAAIGAIGALLVTDTSLGVPALIGILMLVGIVVTNAIVFIDLVNHYRAQGMGVQESVVEGGRRRLRPILMTAFATIFALLPMALGVTGEGGFISRPLALVVIGGLISSTLLTLVLVPTLYTMVERRKEGAFARRERRPVRKEERATTNATAKQARARAKHAKHARSEPVGVADVLNTRFWSGSHAARSATLPAREGDGWLPRDYASAAMSPAGSHAAPRSPAERYPSGAHAAYAPRDGSPDATYATAVPGQTVAPGAAPGAVAPEAVPAGAVPVGAAVPDAVPPGSVAVVPVAVVPGTAPAGTVPMATVPPGAVPPGTVPM
jgi:hydrophobic/amphiphilic exporter-1 (mainly G- bacteria), HAE1 family